MSPRRAGPMRGLTVADDGDLLDAVAHGDLGGLGALYDRYHRDVHRAVQRSMAGSAEVDDVVHAVFLELPKLASRFEGSSCRAWLCGIAVRMALRHQRGAGRWLRTLKSFGTAQQHASRVDPEQSAIGNQEMAVFTRALARLSPKKRAAFVLVEVEGLSTEDAAAALEVPPATLRTRLFHAKNEMRAALKRGGVW
jgi:RNA polymerase sigma-70 factor (ECF subfamily)